MVTALDSSRTESTMPALPELAMTLDDVALGLQELRLAHGNPSYANISSRITQRRIHNGVTAQKAAIARSTVYDCFRTGRSRINADLVSEIVLVLTDDNQSAALWREQCLRAHAPSSVTGVIPVASSDTSAATQAVNTVATLSSVLDSSATDSLAPNKFAEPDVHSRDKRAHGGGTRLFNRLTRGRTMRYSPQFIIALFLITIALDRILPDVHYLLFGAEGPVFADMLGTAIVAMLLGPRWGVAQALLVRLVWHFFHFGYTPEPQQLAFSLVAMSGALVWGYGVHKWRMAENLQRFMCLNALVGLVCTLVAYPIVMTLFGSAQIFGTGRVVAEQVMLIGVPQGAAYFIGNLMMSLADKMLFGAIGGAIIGSALQRHMPAQFARILSPISATVNRVAARITSVLAGFAPA